MVSCGGECGVCRLRYTVSHDALYSHPGISESCYGTLGWALVALSVMNAMFTAASLPAGECHLQEILRHGSEM